jgi:hypothetical protein
MNSTDAAPQMGSNPTAHLWPSWLDLKTPSETLNAQIADAPGIQLISAFDQVVRWLDVP